MKIHNNESFTSMEFIRNVIMRLIIPCIAVTLAFAAGPAFASTPDGETPAVETVCDGLTGAEWGLCNAYCEAMDCDSEYPSASDSACERVLSNFQEHADGEDPPCLEPVGPVVCPCFTAAELDAVLFERCPDGDGTVACRDIEGSQTSIFCNADQGSDPAVEAVSQANGICVFTDNVDFDPQIISYELSEEEIALCNEIIRSRQTVELCTFIFP